MMPAAAEFDVTLKDGTIAHIRPIRPDDDRDLIEGFRQLSPESVFQRFFSAMPELPPGMARYLANVNYTNRLALIAEICGQIVAVARYERTSEPDVVELGLVVLDSWQNRGLGRLLLRRIVEAAGRNGIRHFRADVLASNRRMLRLLSEEMWVEDRKFEGSIVSFRLAK